METVHLKILTNAKREKHLLRLPCERDKTGGDTEFEHLPNEEKIKAISEAEKGKITEANSIDGLFVSI